MTLNQIASNRSMLKTREGLAFLIGYAKHQGLADIESAFINVCIDCIILCDVYIRDVDAFCEVMQIADIDFTTN